MSRDGWDDWYRNREKRRHAVKPSAGKVAAAIDFYRPAGTPSVAIGDLTVIDEAGPFDPFVVLCVADGLPEPCREYPFHPDRRWRFDYAWPKRMLAVECEGGVWTQGRHTRGEGFIADMEKYNAAVQLGWRLLRFTPEQLLAGAVAQIAELLRWLRVETIGDATLYLGDCLEILPTLPKVDAVITDPPYGQAYKVNTFYAGGSRDSAVVQRNGKTLMVRPNVYEPIRGDDEPFDPSPWLTFAPIVMFWGAHKFADRLPPGSWLVWNKVPTGKIRDQGDGEAAWINRDGPLRIFRLLWDGLCVGEGARHECTAGQKRLHPAQKPEALMHWCISQAKWPALILDPYMGSGSTGVAAAQMGLKFIGIESDERYFDIACERIDNAYRQQRMFA